MILPSKKLRPRSSLIHIGGRVLAILDEPKTVSQVWEELRATSAKDSDQNTPAISYDWFVLTLDLLFVMGALEASQGRLKRRSA
jgi:hypothetical protein